MRHIYSHLSMSAQNSIVLLFTFTLLNPFVAGVVNDWNYEDQEIWSHQNHECAGVQQSPINIDKRATSVNSSLNLEFQGYQNLIFGFNGVNNGHSVQFNYVGDERSAPAISGSALNHENYSLAQFHFHWGQQRGLGSEHTVNDKSYSMELHLVHYNRKYSTFQEALTSGKGVAVLGIFFQIERQKNPNLEEISRLVHLVQERSANFTVNPELPIKLAGLLPDQPLRHRFYRYMGSLTTPPCTEGITWLMMADPNLIGLEQIDQLRQARNFHQKNLIGNNYRQLQNLRGRVVEASFDSHKDSSSSIGPNSIVLLLSLLSMLALNLGRE